MARNISGDPPDPNVALSSPAAPAQAPVPGPAAPPGDPNPRLAAARGRAVFGSCGPSRGPTFACWPGGSSWAAAGSAEPVFAGRCGLGTTSSLRMRLWHHIFASEPVAAPHLRFLPCRDGRPRLLAHCDGRSPAPCPPVAPSSFRAHRGAASACRPPVVHFAHSRDAPSTARGDFRPRGYCAWPGKPSRCACMSTVPGGHASPWAQIHNRRTYHSGHFRAQHTGVFGITELNS
jgi:hypothetical protein